MFERIEDASGENQESTLPGSVSGSGLVSSFVALMVCDIRGFTTATESLSKGDLAQTLGGWFRDAANLIHQSGGNIDKFIGDAIFAYWIKGEVQPSECQMAFESGRKLLRLAASRAWPGSHGPFEIAVALNCGSVTCRNIGVMAEGDATILGDAVNTVFRLEALTKALKQPIIASDDFVSSLPTTEGLIDLGQHALKGKQNPVRVFGLNESVGGDDREAPGMVWRNG
jgi:adenylate cyclase